jgi:hypothetical protein
MTRHEEIEAIELTPEEIDDAIYEGKVKKFFYERNKDKWDDPDEKLKSKDDGTNKKQSQS